ncbi:MAG: HDOD domain-containing protein [Pseudomonadales bacterium]|nr:HDOD domain-containing protein [Pseudomonadales bacterium]
MSDVAVQVANDIQVALDADQLDLPSLPEVALEIRDVAESETVSAVTLAAVVDKDPGLAAQLVRVANSPMFRATRSIDDLSQAISRLGVEYAANIITGLAMQQMFQATTELIDKKMRQVWRQSTQVAAWSSILCKKYTRLRPDQATLAGLTHTIGVLPILSWVEENDHIVRDGMTLDRIIDAIHPSIGTMILQRWNFAEEIVAVPESYQNLDRHAVAPDYIDIVSISSIICQHDGDQNAIEDEWDSTDAFERIGIPAQLDDDDFASIAEEVTEVQDVFG